MSTWQMAFWRTLNAWWLDGCPNPRTWYWMRLMGEGTARVIRTIGLRLLPAIRRASVALQEFATPLSDQDSGADER